MKKKIRDVAFREDTLTRIAQMCDIIYEYQQQGLRLTARQLYYQLVARGLIQNKDTEYKKVTAMLTDARYAGLVDWDAIEDRGREPNTPRSPGTGGAAGDKGSSGMNARVPLRRGDLVTVAFELLGHNWTFFPACVSRPWIVDTVQSTVSFTVITEAGFEFPIEWRYDHEGLTWCRGTDACSMAALEAAVALVL